MVAMVACASLIGCASGTVEDVMRNVVQAQSGVTINGFGIDRFAGINFLRTVNFHGGQDDVSSRPFVPLYEEQIGALHVIVDAAADDADAAKATMTDLRADGSSARSALTAALRRYVDVRQRLSPDEALPTVRFRLLRDEQLYRSEFWQIERNPAELDMTLVASLPEHASADSDRDWAARKVSTLAHELSHFRKVKDTHLFPNEVTDETIASLIDTYVWWALKGEDLPADLFGADLGADFKARARTDPLSVTAARFAQANPTHIGSILAQAIIWKTLGPDAVPYANDAARMKLLDLCANLSRHPVDLTRTVAPGVVPWGAVGAD